MKVHKIDDVKFSLEKGSGDHVLSRTGELHLSVEGVIIREGESLFELPFGSLRSLVVSRTKPLRLRFASEKFNLELEGTRAERLWALRALILPTINGGNVPKPGLKTMLVLRCTGVKDMGLIGRIMGLDERLMEELMVDARLQGYLNNEDVVTEEGMLLFSGQEKKFVKCLEDE